MVDLTLEPETVFEDTRDGDPHHPVKDEIRTLLREMADAITASPSGGGGGGSADVSEYSIREALGYMPAREDGQYLVISAPYHFVRVDQLHLTHLAATAGVKVLNLSHLPRGALLRVRTDHTSTFRLIVDAENNGRFYASNPRNGQGVATNLNRAMALRPDHEATVRVRTRTEMVVQEQSRHDVTIVIPTNPSGVTYHEFEERDGYYAWTAYVTIPAAGSIELTLPTVVSHPESGNFPGIDEAMRWDITLAQRHVSLQMLQNSATPPTPAGGYTAFNPPHPGALSVTGNDTKITLYNPTGSTSVAALLRIGKLIPLLTLV